MAVAFLAISRRGRASVSTETDSTTAKLAADSALAQAEAQIVSGFLTTTNPYVSSLLVSTNYINGYGFVPGDNNPTNVNYNNYSTGGSLAAADLQQNIANLQYLPRPPVYATNYLFGYNELQFYLDLNRNGRYDTNGWVTNVDNSNPPIGLGTTNWEVGDPEWIGVLEHPDAPHSANNPFIARYAFIAVPANSLDLNHIHNQVFDTPTTPSGSSIQVSPTAQDAYFRNQGVGTWEINLAAFLADLNANRWGQVIGNPVNGDNTYYYFQYTPANNQGYAFADANALTAWRYANNYNLLASADSVFWTPNDLALADNGIDLYSMGPQPTNFDSYYDAYPKRGLPWAGADNTNNFFSSPAELFNTNRSSIEFVNNLYSVGTSNSTYDRYTFYRLLGQLGTDTAPEADKINLNYSNAAVNYYAGGQGTNIAFSVGVVPGAETNLVPWVPINFFTAAADKLLHAYSTVWYEENPSNYIQSYYGVSEYYYTNIDGLNVTNISHGSQVNQIPNFGITNIPVYINGQFVYSSAVNRLLQLTANIYDASTNTVNSSSDTMNYPSVFRPVFWVTNEFSIAFNRTFTNVYIAGYQYVNEPLLPTSPAIFTTPYEVTALQGGLTASNVWGVPWIIGAKKGFPNFNAFDMVNSFFVERELEVTRNSADASGGTFPYGRTYTTNQMYIMSVSNALGVEDWNSYVSNYNNEVTIVAQDNLSVAMTMTNGAGTAQSLPFYNSYTMPLGLANTTNVTKWSGYLGEPTGDPSFIMPLVTNTMWLTNSVFYYGPGTYFGYPGPGFVPLVIDPSNYLDSGTPPLPQLVLQTTNHLQAYMVDSDTRHIGTYILDYVQLGSMNSSINVNQSIADPDNTGLWSTNYYSSSATPYGVIQQILTSQNGNVPTEDNDGGVWNGSGGNSGYITPAAQQAFFSAFFSPNDTAQMQGGPLVSNFELSVQAPYTPIRLAVQKFVFEANDPLVHYLSSDLSDPTSSTNSRTLDNPALIKLGVLSDRYMPWGNTANQFPTLYYYYGSIIGIPTDYRNHYNLAYKDPAVRSADNWDFPTNKYPTVGWLGRVHRGTPWQSVFLKSTNILAWDSLSGNATWALWTGDQNAYDAYNSAPVQDRVLFDLFTATPDSASTAGRLNVNIGANDPNNSLAGLASWSALLSGAITFSNDLSNTRANAIYYQNPLPSQSGVGYAPWTIQPAGLNSADSPMTNIVRGINSARTNFVGIDGLQGTFEHVGDVLSASELSDASPFLNWNNAAQQENAISDEMYEWLPQQMMSLVTASGTPQSPPRYVVYCYGQTLKPAPDGLVTTGDFFGLCTNYQVEAESAARAIIRVENAPTSANPNATPHIIVEQYNPLPPD